MSPWNACVVSQLSGNAPAGNVVKSFRQEAKLLKASGLSKFSGIENLPVHVTRFPETSEYVAPLYSLWPYTLEMPALAAKTPISKVFTGCTLLLG